jgi:hypothetical protein
MDRLENEKACLSYQDSDDTIVHLLNVGHDEGNYERKSKRRLKTMRIVLVGSSLLLVFALLAVSVTSQ